MTNQINKLAEIGPRVCGGFDTRLEAEEIANLPRYGKPTTRKRDIARVLEECALHSLGNPELATRLAGAITTYDKGVREDVVFNIGLRQAEQEQEKEKGVNTGDENTDTLQDEQQARAALADALFKYQH